MAKGKLHNAVRCPFCPRRRLITSAGWYTHLKNRHPEVPLTTPHPSKSNASDELAKRLQAAPAAAPPSAPAAAPSEETPVETPDGDGEHNGATPQGATPKGKAQAPKAESLKEAALVALMPRRFETTTALLWVAKEITEREWGWPKMEPGEWLDNFIYFAMHDYGWAIGGYQKITRGGEQDGRNTGGPEAAHDGRRESTPAGAG